MRFLMLGIVLATAAAICPTTSADDQQIAEFIKAKLLEEKQRGNLFGFNVDMRVDRGTVWFKGFVSNRSQELMILRTAQLAGHLGVVQVVDDIDVNGQFAENAAQAQPVMRQDVQQQRPAMTSIQNSVGPAMPQYYPQQQPMDNQVHQQDMYQQDMQQRMYQQEIQQHLYQQQQMQAAPVHQSTPRMQQRSQTPRPMGSQTQAEMDSSAQRVGYQEPMFAPDMDRMGAPYQQQMQSGMPYQNSYQPYSNNGSHGQPVPAPSFQQAVMTPMRAPQNSMAPPMPAETRVTTPVKLVSATSQPLPFARATAAAQCCENGACGGMMGGPMMADGGCGGYGGDTGINSDSANLPGYAWPSYASHPNYGAVSYPKQYSPSAWPYIGPFYPYPQVPLGWRKVALEWDDGWWYLDFNDKN